MVNGKHGFRKKQPSFTDAINAAILPGSFPQTGVKYQALP
jgi:hypothetical protein